MELCSVTELQVPIFSLESLAVETVPYIQNTVLFFIIQGVMLLK